MSWEAVTWAVKVLEQPICADWKPPVRFVLFIMANRADEDGVLYPSVRWIMERTRLSESAVRAATRQIQVAGLLVKEKQIRGDGGQSSNLYRLAMSQYVLKLVPPGAPIAGGVSPNAPRGASNAGEGVQEVDRPGPSGGPEDTKNKKKESSSLCPLSADLFDQAWKAYPKRAGNNPKPKAMKAWNARMRERVDPALILAGVQRYTAFCVATGKVGLETVMMAATFFGADKPYEQAWEIPVVRKPAGGAPWWSTEQSILAMGKEIGLAPRPGESWQQFKGRVSAELEKRGVPA